MTSLSAVHMFLMTFEAFVRGMGGESLVYELGFLPDGRGMWGSKHARFVALKACAGVL